MYGAEAMNMQMQQQQQQISQIEEEEDDEVPCGESTDNSQMRFEGHALQDGGGEMNGVDGVYPHASYVPGSEIPLATGGGGTDQLTLTFQGEVYVFDSVSPVKAVLLLLGGYEAPATISAIGVASQNHRGSPEKTKPLIIESGNPSVKQNEQDSLETLDTLIDNSILQVETSSANLDNQETVDELASTSGAKFEIPIKFDSRYSFFSN